MPPGSSRPPDVYRQLFEQNLAVELIVDFACSEIVDVSQSAADFYGLTCEALTRAATAGVGVGAGTSGSYASTLDELQPGILCP